MNITLTLPYFPSNNCYSSGRRETRKQHQDMTTIFSFSTGEVLALKYSKENFQVETNTSSTKREENKSNKQMSRLNMRRSAPYKLCSKPTR